MGIEDINGRLAQRRKDLGISLQALAKRLGEKVNWQKIQHWEKGRSRPKMDELPEIAKALETSEQWLLFGDGGPEQEASIPIDESREQLLSDWSRLPLAWKHYICHKTSELAAAADELPEIVKESMRPIQDEKAYRDWEERIEAKMRAGELVDFTMEMRKRVEAK